jgi:hypothetical protein
LGKQALIGIICTGTALPFAVTNAGVLLLALVFEEELMQALFTNTHRQKKSVESTHMY